MHGTSSNGSWPEWLRPSRPEKEQQPVLPGTRWPLKSWVFIPVSDGKSPEELDSQGLQFSAHGGLQQSLLNGWWNPVCPLAPSGPLAM